MSRNFPCFFPVRAENREWKFPVLAAQGMQGSALELRANLSFGTDKGADF
jgi:hypothetical protein